MACSALEKIYCPIDTRPATHALINHKPKLRNRDTNPADRFGETDVAWWRQPEINQIMSDLLSVQSQCSVHSASPYR
ncbi:MAG TPA: hypothetical protein QF700_04435 [Prochlorococcus sp.]|nr:hypothetical protein [Prochlorococcus sp.]